MLVPTIWVFAGTVDTEKPGTRAAQDLMSSQCPGSRWSSLLVSHWRDELSEALIALFAFTAGFGLRFLFQGPGSIWI